MSALTALLVRNFNVFNGGEGRALSNLFLGGPEGGAGTCPTSNASVVEHGNDLVGRRTEITLSGTTITITDDAGVAQYGGVKIYDFPLGLINVKSVIVSGLLTAGVTGTIIDNWDGDVAVGTVTATTGSTLTSTEADILPSTAVSAGASDKIGVVTAFPVPTALTESGARWLNGTATAIDAFLNFLIDDDATHTTGTATFAGKVIINWTNEGTV